MKGENIKKIKASEIKINEDLLEELKRKHSWVLNKIEEVVKYCWKEKCKYRPKRKDYSKERTMYPIGFIEKILLNGMMVK